MVERDKPVRSVTFFSLRMNNSVLLWLDIVRSSVGAGVLIIRCRPKKAYCVIVTSANVSLQMYHFGSVAVRPRPSELINKASIESPGWTCVIGEGEGGVLNRSAEDAIFATSSSYSLSRCEEGLRDYRNSRRTCGSGRS